MTPPVLAAGDNFVLSSLLTDAVLAEVPSADVTSLDLPWPDVAFGQVAEVDEASGTEDDLIEALAGRQVLVTQMAPVTERVLRSSPDLRLIAVSRGGPVNVNIPAATEAGVAVCYAPGRNATATAEMSVGLLLAVLRRIPETHAHTAAGEWRGDYYRYERCGLELEGTPVGLVGFGAVGSRVAKVLNAFGAKVRVYDPYADQEALAAYGEPVSDLHELLRQSKIVTLHARVTEETRGLIGRAELAAMPAGSYLVNAARGPLLDYAATCDALESGHLAGAAFDTFETEPIPAGDRLLSAPNVVMTPHIAGASKAVAEKAARIVAAEVGRWVRGEPLANCSNPEVLSS
ncbi:2-hydroxyacid dehydrogenase [Goodfellowiella coeruleoviolacea]|uniref:D-3-phosphoglycerate dehydrogenase n=1 Tax=Goodfellowiella coeruleoviolacea TaxID=334858 RepID=A0AAE3GA70_9PSEU|nr:2-hydroxyacid dehydrogenase [Goodfellowiella coeruleoviolacea]MCP2164522.1 D-3-phosphoglycerate dehydrogenase [Goodfellowiella coeruleoviolacea]